MKKGYAEQTSALVWLKKKKGHKTKQQQHNNKIKQ